MAAAGTMLPRPRHLNNIGLSSQHNDLTEEEYRDLRRPRKVRFYANGNRYFQGKKLHITPHRYLSFNDLLNDLTNKLPTNVRLPYGVRQIFSPNTGRRLHDIQELQDGHAYVCGGFDTFKPINYGSEGPQPWNVGAAAKPPSNNVFDFNINRPSYGNSYRGFPATRPLRHSYPNGRRPNYGTFGARAGQTSYWGGGLDDTGPIKPKVVTIIRNGPTPRPNVKILLNRRSVQSFEQLMKDIAEAFGPKYKHNKIRKLFNLKGRESQGISDFFRDDDVFIGIGNESLTTGDVQDILEELYPDSPYAKNLMREWEKTRKRYQPSYLKNDDPKRDEGKKDSGLGSDGSKDENDDVIYQGDHYPRRGKKKKREDEENLPLRIERERMRAAEDERERARKRMQKQLNAERRVMDEERRKRGLVPLKPIQDRVLSPMSRPRSVKSRAHSRAQSRARSRRKYRSPREDSDDEPKVIVVVKDNDTPPPPQPPRVRTPSPPPRIRTPPPRIPSPPPREPTPEKPKKKKHKLPIYKTKPERQITNPDYVGDIYDAGRTLGDGNFAIVKQCKLRHNQHEYAMKIIDKSKLKGKEHMVENEIEIMKMCNHPNIARLMEEFETKEEIYLIMELVKGGDLFDAITQSVKFNEEHSARMVNDLAKALFYLHSRGIVHRDLKPENLLVQRNKDSSITLKLADFGLAMDVKEPIYTVCGTPTYVAPEILAETGYGLEVDMWAVGVIAYILLCGFPPFRSPDRKQTELFEFIKAGEYEFLSPYWDNISQSGRDLIRHLLVVDVKRRYTAVDVMCHPWIITAGGTVSPPTQIEDYRKNLRRELENEGRNNKDHYRQYKKNGPPGKDRNGNN